jgi:hypothetical protein
MPERGMLKGFTGPHEVRDGVEIPLLREKPPAELARADAMAEVPEIDLEQVQPLEDKGQDTDLVATLDEEDAKKE